MHVCYQSYNVVVITCRCWHNRYCKLSSLVCKQAQCGLQSLLMFLLAKLSWKLQLMKLWICH